jgi:hypothetical protein
VPVHVATVITAAGHQLLVPVHFDGNTRCAQVNTPIIVIIDFLYYVLLFVLFKILI